NELDVLVKALQGDDQANPFVIDIVPATIAGSNLISAEGSSFTDTYTAAENGQNAPDVFYQITAPDCAVEMTASTCGSSFNTFLHVLDATGAVLSSVDNNCGDDATITWGVDPGQTYLIVVEGAGAAVGDFTLDLTATEFEINLGEDLQICAGQQVLLSAEGPEGASYLWSTGATSSEITVAAAGIYTVTVTNEAGCAQQDEIVITEVPDITPGPVEYLVPSNGRSDLELPVSFLWIADPNASYDFYLWKQGESKPSVPFAADLATNTLSIENGLDLITTYNWQVVASNSCGSQFVEGPEWVFTTADLPDVSIQSATVDPTTLFVEDPLSISISYENLGLAEVLDMTVSQSFYLSADTEFDGETDVLVGSASFDIERLTAEDTLEVVQELQLPTGWAPGDYYVIIDFDVDNTEGNLENNTFVTDRITIEATPIADLQLKDLTYQSLAVSSGEELVIEYAMENLGTKDIGTAFEDRVYLTTSATFSLTTVVDILADFENRETITEDMDGNPLVNPVQGFQLPIGGRRSTSAYVTIPESLTPGTYYVHIAGDAKDVLTEANEENNIVSGGLLLVNAPMMADLAPTRLDVSVTTATGTDIIQVSWQVTNLGDAIQDARSWIDALYIAPTNTCQDLTTCALPLHSASFNTSLGSPLLEGATYEMTEEVYLPNSLDGDYYIYLMVNEIINPDNTLPDNRNNNLRIAAQPITITPSDNPPALCGDDYSSPCPIQILENNFGYGSVPLNSVDLTNATLQPWEAATFPEGYANQKSLWYEFTIPTSRSVSINIEERFNQAHVGNSDISVMVFNKPEGDLEGTLPLLPGGQNDLAPFTPLISFGRTANACLNKGTYLIRISAGDKYLSNFPLRAELEVNHPESFVSDNVRRAMQYDRQDDPFLFPFPLGHQNRVVEFESGCLSIDDQAEVDELIAVLPDLAINGVSVVQDYDQTAWFTFETDDHIDALHLELNAVKDFVDVNHVGYRLYEGDARTTPRADLVQVEASILTRETVSTRPTRIELTPRNLACVLNANSTYSIQFFIHRDHQNRFRLKLHDLGEGPSQGANPADPYLPFADNGNLLPVPKADVNVAPPEYNLFGTLTRPGGFLSTIANHFDCATYIDNHTCPAVAPDASFDRAADQLDLRQWYVVSFDEDVNVWINNWTVSQFRRLRVYPGDVRDMCSNGLSLPNPWPSEISTDNPTEALDFGAFRAACLPSGVYTIEVMSRADESNVLHPNSSLGGSNELEIYTLQVPQSHQFTLADKDQVDKINNGEALEDAGTDPTNFKVYSGVPDVLGCATTDLPLFPDGVCDGLAERAGIYRQIVIGEPGVLIVQNAFFFEHGLYQLNTDADVDFERPLTDVDFLKADLVEEGDCFGAGVASNESSLDFCVRSGTYIFAAFGDDENVGTVSEPSFLFRKRPIDVPQFSKPGLAEQMDTLDLPADGSYLESQSAFVTCDAHVYTINGEGPCKYNG
ncbi:MAG: hypothetical protein AAGA85_22995, partial [Bacteroidota bacterium]